MLFNLNDYYYINQAIDDWLTEPEDPNITKEEKNDFNVYKERCLPDD